MSGAEPLPRRDLGRLAAVCGVSLGLAALVLWQAAGIRASKSATYDETIYLNAGVRMATTGRVRELGELGIAPLPLWLIWAPAVRGITPAQRPSAFDLGRRDDPILIARARRIAAWLIGVPLPLVMFFWIRRRHGILLAAICGAIAACSPSLAAHSALATTDATLALTTLLALVAIDRAVAALNLSWALLAGAAVGLAVSAKYSGLFLGFLLAGGLALAAWRSRMAGGVTSSARSRAGRAAVAAGRCLLAAALAGLAVIWLAHGLELAPFVEGLRFQARHSAEGDYAYLLGEKSLAGWWSYFPIAFFCKSTPPELLLFAALPGAWLVSRRLEPGPTLDPTRWLWLAAAVIYAAAAIFSRINLGHRYLLPLYPPLLLLACDAWAAPWRRWPRAVGASLALLIAMQAAAAWRIAPDQLAYFNEWVGGPESGHRYLLDSNLDWGQDLPALAEELKRLGFRRPALEYFGTALPQAYGVPSRPLSRVRDQLESCDAVAISVTMLFGVYSPGDGFPSLRALPRAGRAGYSIWIYDLRRPEVLAALRADLARKL